ncbi:MAG: hypothetical protein V4686_01965 [Patescibacteria group bacterium]
MKKIENYTQFKVGGIYNRVYIGPNEAYAKINGKETFIVTSLTPLEAQVLYAQNGSLHTSEIRGGKTTFTDPDYAFKNFDLFEPEGEDEWFKKSARCTSISEAIKKNLLTPEQVKQTSIREGNIVSHWGHQGFEFHSYGFNVEPTTEFPYLQRVYICWKDRDTAKIDAVANGTTVQQ